MQKLSVVLSVIVLLLAACNSQKQPAEAAFAQAQASVAPVSAELEKYAPEEFAKLTALLDDMKSKLNSRDYAGAVALRAQVMGQLVAASGAAGQRKNELLKQFSNDWQTLAASIPQLLAQLNSRENYLQGVGKLPKGVGAEGVQQAKQALIDLDSQWAAAMNAARNRDPESALTKAHEIQKRGAEIGAMIGLKTAS
jgi:hypothetical protein